MNKKEICDRIKYIRQGLKITQENMADSMGISLGEYYKLENGKHNFNIEQIVLLSKIFKVHVVSFFIDQSILSLNGLQHHNIVGSNVNNKIIAAEVPLNYNLKNNKEI
ncbi:MAG: helix-turn-helix domain-containing protein [Paludibacteraceae bacterium]|nr:helix-turn-helix domain-containing protein [Paludibacteraceae bacterium]